METFNFILIVSSVVLATLALPVFTDLALTAKRPMSLLISIVVGFFSIAVLNVYGMNVPLSVRRVGLPLLMAVVFGALSLNRVDWTFIYRNPPMRALASNRTRDIFIICGGALGALAGLTYRIGIPLLNALGQDVRGLLDENIEINCTSILSGFIFGSYLFIILWSCVVSFCLKSQSR